MMVLGPFGLDVNLSLRIFVTSDIIMIMLIMLCVTITLVPAMVEG